LVQVVNVDSFFELIFSGKRRGEGIRDRGWGLSFNVEFGFRINFFVRNEWVMGWHWVRYSNYFFSEKRMGDGLALDSFFELIFFWETNG